jgi:dTDP-4-amino-4,6-dideoxygalactose transaminase
MKIPYVNLGLQHQEIKKEILLSLEKIIDSGHFVLGEEVQIFERNLARYCNTKFAIGVNSGTDALFLVLKAFGIKKGDEVILPSNSFISTASVVVAVGAKPVFADIKDDLNIDPDSIKKVITSKTKAILPVHLTGKPAAMKEILAIAKERNIKVVEDAAQAIGTTYYNKKTGSLSDAGCFSFHPLKTLNACGDAGGITTDDEELYLKILQLRNIGLKNRNEFDFWGYNSRLDSIQAAILNIKFDYLDQWIEKRRSNAFSYINGIQSDFINLPDEKDYEKHSFHVFVINTDQRDELAQYLHNHGIETRIHYPIPIHLQKASDSFGFALGSLPVTEYMSKRILTLPVHQNLKDYEVQYIIDTINNFKKN